MATARYAYTEDYGREYERNRGEIVYTNYRHASASSYANTGASSYASAGSSNRASSNTRTHAGSHKSSKKKAKVRWDRVIGAALTLTMITTLLVAKVISGGKDIAVRESVSYDSAVQADDDKDNEGKLYVIKANEAEAHFGHDFSYANSLQSSDLWTLKDFAICRISYGEDAEGDGSDCYDTSYTQYIEWASEQGIDTIGLYCFSYPQWIKKHAFMLADGEEDIFYTVEKNSAEREAEAFSKKFIEIQKEFPNISFFPIFDWEPQPLEKEYPDINLSLVINWDDRDEKMWEDDGYVWKWFKYTYSATGIRPVVYMSASQASQPRWKTLAKYAELWVAYYPENLTEPTKFVNHDYDLSNWRTIAWQYNADKKAGENGSVEAFVEDFSDEELANKKSVDKNISYLTSEQWKERCRVTYSYDSGVVNELPESNVTTVLDFVNE